MREYIIEGTYILPFDFLKFFSILPGVSWILLYPYFILLNRMLADVRSIA